MKIAWEKGVRVVKEYPFKESTINRIEQRASYNPGWLNLLKHGHEYRIFTYLQFPVGRIKTMVQLESWIQEKFERVEDGRYFLMVYKGNVRHMKAGNKWVRDLKCLCGVKVEDGAVQFLAVHDSGRPYLCKRLFEEV